MRRLLSEALQASPGFQLVGEAQDGRQAVEMCQRLRPDVVTMDMVMPDMDGLAATEQIMAHCPTPILVVSSSFNRGEMFQTYDALAAGAVDVLDKNHLVDSRQNWEARLLSTLRIVAKVKVITHPRGRLGSMGRERPLQPPQAFQQRREGCRLLAIGGSTGGPGAVVEILRALPPSLPIPILLVLHVSRPFGDNLCEWLDSQSSYRVRYPRQGERLSEATGVFMAPPDRHLVLQQGRLYLNQDKERHSCRPSVDVLFESLAREVAGKTCACLLTGMGVDGAAGLLALRQAGARTLAQDEKSCVVYGMPREAAKLGAAQTILPLSEIASAMAQALQGDEVPKTP